MTQLLTMTTTRKFPPLKVHTLVLAGKVEGKVLLEEGQDGVSLPTTVDQALAEGQGGNVGPE